jgi:hypothetical protein
MVPLPRVRVRVPTCRRAQRVRRAVEQVTAPGKQREEAEELRLNVVLKDHVDAERERRDFP